MLNSIILCFKLTIETLVNRTTKYLLPDFTVKKESFRLAKEKVGTNLMLPTIEKIMLP